MVYGVFIVWIPKDGQDGIKFLSTGLMRAIRKPTAHEPTDSQHDFLDHLSFISFLFRQLDKAVTFKAKNVQDRLQWRGAVDLPQRIEPRKQESTYSFFPPNPQPLPLTLAVGL